MICKYSTAAAAVENPISPPVGVNYNQLLIDGKFVDAASGEISQHSFTHWYICITYIFFYLNFSILWLPLAAGKTFPTLDPRTGDVIAHVAEGNAEDINRAVAVARKAFDEGPWPKMTAYVTIHYCASYFSLVI